jgi:hypothetical protein
LVCAKNASEKFSRLGTFKELHNPPVNAPTAAAARLIVIPPRRWSRI